MKLILVWKLFILLNIIKRLQKNSLREKQKYKLNIPVLDGKVHGLPAPAKTYPRAQSMFKTWF